MAQRFGNILERPETGASDTTFCEFFLRVAIWVEEEGCVENDSVLVRKDWRSRTDEKRNTDFWSHGKLALIKLGDGGCLEEASEMKRAVIF